MFDRMEFLAKEKGWSRSEFLRRVGLNSSAMRDWRVGKSAPDKHMHMIVSVLGTTEAYLRGETENPRPDNQQGMDELTWNMLDGFRELSDDDKREMLAILDVKKKLKGKK